MAQTRTAKLTAAAKSSGTTLTIPDVSMVGGDFLMVAVGYDTDESANPTVTYGAKVLDLQGGVTTTAGNKRVRVTGEIINNTRTADIKATWPSAVTAKTMIAVSLHQAGKMQLTDENENAADTISTTGAFRPIEHIQTLLMSFHLTEGPIGDAIGSSSTGCTLGQRVGTSGDADTTNVTLQETYKIIAASTVAAGSFVIDEYYQIKTIGTTDFTLIGALSNTVGERFKATGVGTGNGDAYHHEEARSRLSGLATRDHVGIMFFMQPKRTYSIQDIYQPGRNMNENPYWVRAYITDDNGRGFRIRIHPKRYKAWSDAQLLEEIAEYCGTWEVNLYDSNLEYEEDTDLTDRFADLIGEQVVL